MRFQLIPGIKFMPKSSVLMFVLAFTLFNLLPASAAIINISAQEAYDFLDPGDSAYIPSAYLLDVRTPAEWLSPGHPGKSDSGLGTFLEEPERKVINIPVLYAGVQFLDEVSSRFEADDYLLVICAGGGRSLFAAQRLEESGFLHIYNVSKGFSGDWVPSGLPSNLSLEGMWAPTAAPEPCALLLLGSGLLGLVARRFKFA